jgi:hypothetical protein
MQNKKIGIFLVILTVLVLVGGVYVFKKKIAKPQPVYVNSQITQSDKVLVPGFPKELAVGVRQIESSYRREYDSGQDQYTTEFLSTYSAVPEAFDAYYKILTDSKYSIIGQTKNPTNANIYGRSADGTIDASVVINLKNGAVAMVVTYLKNNNK